MCCQVGEKAGKKSNYLHSNSINSVRAALVPAALDSVFHPCTGVPRARQEGVCPVVHMRQEHSEGGVWL